MEGITAHEEWQCVDFAEMLLRDDVRVKKYQNEDKRKYNFVRAVLKDWLSRDDDDSTDSAVPRTWSALAECVSDARLDGTLAKAIRETCPAGEFKGAILNLSKIYKQFTFCPAVNTYCVPHIFYSLR